ncbi:hypothetical protein KZ498_11510 [Haloarcula sp. 1CSR25-25]|nr:hypothetical protein [Haloarcula sp. 1CSR25-25]
MSSPDRQVETPTDRNETQQENPDEVDDGEYSDETATWLARNLASKLENSSISLSSGKYEQAQEILGDDYNDRLNQYVEVAGDTDSDATATTAGEYGAARDNQRQLANEVQRYQTQYTAYQEARESGNETRARVLARRMEQTAANVSDRSLQLNQNYNRIGNTTSVDLSRAQARINETTQNVTTVQSAVREETLVGTTLTVQATSATASFTNPGAITGRLQTENGSVVAEESITLRINNQTQTVRTDSNGRFEIQYRPRSVRLGQQRIQATYDPSPGSVYLTDSDVFAIEVQQVSSTIRTEYGPRNIAYNDIFNISATVTAGGFGVEGVPVEFVIGETVLAQAVTVPNGSVSSSIQFPATVSDGEQTVVARVSYDNRAISGANSESVITVIETPTELSLRVSTVEGGFLARGQFQTTDGRPVPNRTIQIQAGDGDVQTVATEQNGTFQTTVNPSAGDGSVQVVAQYADSDSNLGNASATATISTGGGGPPPVGSEEDLNIIESIWSALLGNDASPPIGFGGGGVGFRWLFTVGGAFTLILVGVAWFVVSHVRASPDQITADTAISDDPSIIGPEPPPELSKTTGQDLIERIETHLENGEYDAATVLSYGAVHDQLTKTHDIRENATHWELLRKSRDNGLDDEQVEAIQTVVEAFETAAFAPRSIEKSYAESASQNAKELRRNGS